MNRDIFRRQALDVCSIDNARQLGGYTGHKGRKIKENVLLRSACLSDASEEDLEKLKTKYNVTLVVDFRTEEESKAMPDHKIDGTTYMCLNVMTLNDPMKTLFGGKEAIKWDEGFAGKLLSYAENGDMQTYYENLIISEKGQDGYAAFLKTLLEQKTDEAVLWHCTQGKDRAGLASIFLLAALGADKETILTDYELSNGYYEKKVAYMEKIAAEKGHNEKTITNIRSMIGVSREIMEHVLKFVDDKYGSLEQYIREQLKITDNDLAELREKYLEP